MLLLLLDDSSEQAVAVDHSIPASAKLLLEVLERTWPRLKGRIDFVEAPLQEIALESTDLVVSVHACGHLTDQVIEKAAATGTRLAVLPCCHNLDTADQGGLGGWLDGTLAVDVVRANKLRTQGYKIYSQRIPADITPKNRLLMAEPDAACAPL